LTLPADHHRPAVELNETAFNALEENFFDACARAIAPIARSYARANSAAAAAAATTADDDNDDTAAAIGAADASGGGGGGGGGVGGVAAELKAKRPELSQQQHQRAAADAAGASGTALGTALESFGADLAQCMRRTRLRVCAAVSLGGACQIHCSM
jgi:protein suppressor of PHYA-105 1